MIKEYFLSNFIMLFEMFGLLFIMRSSVHVPKRTMIYTLVAIILLFLNSVMYNWERLLGNRETFSVMRAVLTYVIYSIQPAIILMVMQIAAPLKKKTMWILIPAIIGAILNFTSPLTKLVCYFREPNDYVGGPLARLPYIIFAFYAVVFIVQTMIYYRRFRTSDKMGVLYVIVASMLGMVGYLVFDYSNDYNAIFTSAIVLYYLFYYIQISKTDSLTGLMRRCCYYKDISTMKRRISAVASVDMNDLKWYNDNCGHAAGDKALVTIADILIKGKQVKKYVYRVGGDEFVILYIGADERAVKADIAYMRELLSKTEYVCAFGYALVTPYVKIEDAIRYSDELMYTDKAALKKAIVDAGGELRLRQ